jgi:hypothetical protein
MTNVEYISLCSQVPQWQLDRLYETVIAYNDMLEGRIGVFIELLKDEPRRRIDESMSILLKSAVDELYTVKLKDYSAILPEPFICRMLSTTDGSELLPREQVAVVVAVADSKKMVDPEKVGDREWTREFGILQWESIASMLFEQVDDEPASLIGGNE